MKVALIGEKKNYDNEIEKLITLFAKEKIEAKFEFWDDDVNWKDYDVLIIKSPWDFIYNPTKFMEWLENIEKICPNVYNSPKLVSWSIKKYNYLKYLQDQGVYIIPTLFVHSKVEENEIKEFLLKEESDTFIVKGGIGAGSIYCEKFNIKDMEKAKEHINDLLKEYPVLVQPFVESIKDGEKSLFFIERDMVLTVVKKPKDGDFRVQSEYGGSKDLFTATKEEIDFGKNVISKIQDYFLYGRVDFVHYKGNPALMELELDSPYLYSNVDPLILEKFVNAVAMKIKFIGK